MTKEIPSSGTRASNKSPAAEAYQDYARDSGGNEAAEDKQQRPALETKIVSASYFVLIVSGVPFFGLYILGGLPRSHGTATTTEN